MKKIRVKSANYSPHTDLKGLRLYFLYSVEIYFTSSDKRSGEDQHINIVIYLSTVIFL
jgi:hypothetical protein